MVAAMVAYTVLAIDEVSYYTSRWLFGWAYGLCWASGPLLIIGGSLNIAARYVKSPPEVGLLKSYDLCQLLSDHPNFINAMYIVSIS